MNEFEFKRGSLEAQGLQEGDVVECTYSDYRLFTAGVRYSVVKAESKLLVKLNSGSVFDRIHTRIVRFKPVAVNVQQQLQGQRLQDILPQCKNGDVLECVSTDDNCYTLGEKYVVYDGNIENDALKIAFTSSSLFIKYDPYVEAAIEKLEEQTEYEHDSWGIGKSYSAPKKEWQPDTLDVDLTKKIWEW